MQSPAPAPSRWADVWLQDSSVPCTGLVLRSCPSMVPMKKETLLAFPTTAPNPRQQGMPTLEVLNLYSRHLLPFPTPCWGAASFLPIQQIPLHPWAQAPLEASSQARLSLDAELRMCPPSRSLHPPVKLALSSLSQSWKECLDFKLNSYSLSHAHRISQKDRTLLTFRIQP